MTGDVTSTAAGVTQRSAAARVAAPLALGALAGTLAGWLWWTWWGPPPPGKVYETQAGPHWYPDPFDQGITEDFRGTATYVIVGFAVALVVGLVSAYVCRQQALAGLVSVLAGSVAGAALMAVVGLSQSPPDPQSRVGDVAIGDVLPGHLHIAGMTPYLAWPVGVLLGYLVVMLSLSSRWERPAEFPVRAGE